MNISNSLTLKAYTLKGQLPPQWKDRTIGVNRGVNRYCVKSQPANSPYRHSILF